MDKQIESKLIKEIGEKRYNHSINVMETAIRLGEVHDVDLAKVKIAGLLHDSGKLIEETNLLKRAYDSDIILDTYMQYNHELIHGPLGAKIAQKQYNIEDKEILDAIYYHTIGRENMTILDKIIYIADYIEPGRKFKGIEEVRQLAFLDLDKSLLLAMDNTINYLILEKK